MKEISLNKKIYGGKFKAIEIELETDKTVEGKIEDLIYKEEGIEVVRKNRKEWIFKNKFDKPQVVTFLHKE